MLREGGGGAHPPAGHAGAGVERAFHIAERFAAASGETVPFADSPPKTADAVDDADRRRSCAHGAIQEILELTERVARPQAE